ncbi:hypothetical protein [Athalassotoga saccharophila]|uniref:hypothetical protein n=1 Tax=Athalassotoga saccharophila TaxID=1441386 RepID=UPI00137A32DF|nr:hypothetical protein [Athalassotoga saccharophila]BBJ27481.1 hypothetical protein ATHSA_0350 [Athalassotoga saccharophila]
MKPKENTIEKIDRLFEKIYATNLDEESIRILKDLQDHLHSMNLHKAKVAYFSLIKSKLNYIFEMLNSSKVDESKKEIKELKKFL